MGTDRAGGDPAAIGPGSRGFVAVLAVLTAALRIHLLGPALQSPGPAAAPAHGHGSLDLAAVHSGDGSAERVGEVHADRTCHAVAGINSATTARPMATCSVSGARQVAAAAIDRSGLSHAWIGGKGVDALADPRRSPGVQRT